MSRNRRRRIGWAVFLGTSALFLALLYFPWSSLPRRKTIPPPAPLCEMTLELARRQWRVGEAPWYLLTVKNTGKTPFFVDRFLHKQIYLNDNSDYRPKGGSQGDGVFFHIFRPDGSLMAPEFMFEWGMHGEFRFWTNEEADLTGPDFTPERMLKPGRTFAATATVVAPIKRRQDGMDARVPHDAKPEERKGYEALWKIHKRDLEALGASTEGLTADPRVLYPGYRVLEGYSFSRPGTYRMKAVYDYTAPLCATSAEEEIGEFEDRRKTASPYKPLSAASAERIRKEWASKSPKEVEDLKKERAETEEYNRLKGFHCESNEAEVVVVP